MARTNIKVKGNTMKAVRFLKSLSLIGIILLLAFVEDALSAGNSGFHISRGVNISHWLSQSRRRGQGRRAYFTEKDVAHIAGLGYDHIRLPVDEEQLWDEGGNKEEEAFRLLNNAIKWSREHNLRVVVDLHILRSHHFNAEEKPLWTDPDAQEKFFQLWKDLSSELKKYPVNRVAYELMNEPVADDPEDWNRLVGKAVKVIRKTEPDRKIVIGSNKWQSANTFDQLRIPEGDRNIILSFHFYTPMLITHYRASWTGVGKYKGPVNYPGRIVVSKDINGLPADIAGIVKRNNGLYNRDVLEKLLQKPLKVAKKYDLPLYCGEWGCLSTVPRKARLQWYADVRHILEKNKIAWANWDYKGGFGIIGRGGQPDEQFIQVLTSK
jgi:endoglucanase